MKVHGQKEIEKSVQYKNKQNRNKKSAQSRIDIIPEKKECSQEIHIHKHKYPFHDYFYRISKKIKRLHEMISRESVTQRLHEMFSRKMKVYGQKGN